jgi:hypothetical protein
VEEPVPLGLLTRSVQPALSFGAVTSAGIVWYAAQTVIFMWERDRWREPMPRIVRERDVPWSLLCRY